MAGLASCGQTLRKMNTTHLLGGNNSARLPHWPRTVNIKVRDDGEILFSKLSLYAGS